MRDLKTTNSRGECRDFRDPVVGFIRRLQATLLLTGILQAVHKFDKNLYTWALFILHRRATKRKTVETELLSNQILLITHRHR